MKTNYTIYPTDSAPEELMAKFPKCATYDPTFCLFGRSLGDVTGTEAETIIDMTQVGYSENEEEITFDGDLFISELTSALGNGEIKINREQAQEIYSRKPVEEAEEV